MNKILKYGCLVPMFFLAACSDFLEPKSQSEYVPTLVKSLDELLLGEAYMGPGSGEDGRLYGVLGLLDDDVATRGNVEEYDPYYETKLHEVELFFSWSQRLKEEYDSYNTYGEVYKKIVGCNAVLDYVDDSEGTEDAKNLVKAQALALRGYYYFHLVNLYAKPYYVGRNELGVPLQLSSELSTSSKARNTVGEVYDQILADLREAERLYTLLPDSEWSLKNNRFNLPCIQLLLSRVYLYMENWQEALAYGEKVINDYSFELKDLNTVEAPSPYGSPSYIPYYTWENPEVIFLFGNEADVVTLPLSSINMTIYDKYGNPNYKSISVCVVSNDLINSYEENDLRKSRYLIWERISSGSETPQYRVPVSKYEVGTYYGMSYGWEAGSWGVAFKVTEAYLNVAEAAAMLYKESGDAQNQTKAINLLERLREKRFASSSPDYKVTVTDPDGLVSFVRTERRRELCFENHRWFDLRRYGMEGMKRVWNYGSDAIEYVLEKDDPRYTLLIPNEAFELNSALIQNELKN